MDAGGERVVEMVLVDMDVVEMEAVKMVAHRELSSGEGSWRSQ
jgi:hypothetical protein